MLTKKKQRIYDPKIRQRLNLIRLAKKVGVLAACEQLGRHRSYYYYWKSRYDQGGWRALVDQSRRPHNMPKLSCEQKVRAVIKARKKTGYGKERLHERLKAQGVLIPISTIGSILKRAGLLWQRRRFQTQKKIPRRYNLLYPGQRVQMDIKYVPSELSSYQQKFYQYTVIDECSRMRYVAWHDSIWNLKAVQTLQEAQAYFGFPIECVQTDNGIEFTYHYTAELTAKYKDPKEHPLDTYCNQQNIRHKLIPPGRKELNGKVERSHRTDDEEFYRNYYKFNDLKSLRKEGTKWLNFYNTKRIHSAINWMTPRTFALQRLNFIPKQNVA